MQAVRPGVATFDVVKEVIVDIATAAQELPLTPTAFTFDTQDMLAMCCIFLGSVTVRAQLDTSAVEDEKPVIIKWKVGK